MASLIVMQSIYILTAHAHGLITTPYMSDIFSVMDVIVFPDLLEQDLIKYRHILKLKGLPGIFYGWHIFRIAHQNVTDESLNPQDPH